MNRCCLHPGGVGGGRGLPYKLTYKKDKIVSTKVKTQEKRGDYGGDERTSGAVNRD